jgi:hypothetical protein
MSKENTTCKLSAVDDAQTTHGNGGQLISKKPGALLLVSAAYLLGGGGMLAWLGFLLMGPPVLGRRLGITGAPAAGHIPVHAFFHPAQHHGPAQFRLWLTRTVRADFHGALYAAASGSCLLLVVGLWQPVGPALVDAGPDPMGDDAAVYGGRCRRLVGLPILGRLRCAGRQTGHCGPSTAKNRSTPHLPFVGHIAGCAIPSTVQPDHYLVLPDVYGGSVAAQRALDHLDHHRRHFGGAGSGRLFRRCLPQVPENRTHAAAHQPETANARRDRQSTQRH